MREHSLFFLSHFFPIISKLERFTISDNLWTSISIHVCFRVTIDRWRLVSDTRLGMWIIISLARSWTILLVVFIIMTSKLPTLILLSRWILETFFVNRFSRPCLCVSLIIFSWFWNHSYFLYSSLSSFFAS